MRARAHGEADRAPKARIHRVHCNRHSALGGMRFDVFRIPGTIVNGSSSDEHIDPTASARGVNGSSPSGCCGSSEYHPASWRPDTVPGECCCGQWVCHTRSTRMPSQLHTDLGEHLRMYIWRRLWIPYGCDPGRLPCIDVASWIRC